MRMDAATENFKRAASHLMGVNEKLYYRVYKIAPTERVKDLGMPLEMHLKLPTACIEIRKLVAGRTCVTQKEWELLGKLKLAWPSAHSTWQEELQDSQHSSRAPHVQTVLHPVRC